MLLLLVRRPRCFYWLPCATARARWSNTSAAACLLLPLSLHLCLSLSAPLLLPLSPLLHPRPVRNLMDPVLDERARPLQNAVETVVQALGEHGVTYRRNLQEWMEGLGRSVRMLEEVNAGDNAKAEHQEVGTAKRNDGPGNPIQAQDDVNAPGVECGRAAKVARTGPNDGGSTPASRAKEDQAMGDADAEEGAETGRLGSKSGHRESSNVPYTKTQGTVTMPVHSDGNSNGNTGGAAPCPQTKTSAATSAVADACSDAGSSAEPIRRDDAAAGDLGPVETSGERSGRETGDGGKDGCVEAQARRSIAPSVGDAEHIKQARDRAYRRLAELVASLPAEVADVRPAHIVDDLMFMAEEKMAPQLGHEYTTISELASQYHRAELHEAYHFEGRKRDACGCSGYDLPHSANAGPPRCGPNDRDFLSTDGEPLYLRIIRIYVEWGGFDSSRLLDAWYGPNTVPAVAAWRSSYRQLRDCLAAVVTMDAADDYCLADVDVQLRGLSEEDVYASTCSEQLLRHAHWAHTLVFSFYVAPVLITNPALECRVSKQARAVYLDGLPARAAKRVVDLPPAARTATAVASYAAWHGEGSQWCHAFAETDIAVFNHGSSGLQTPYGLCDAMYTARCTGTYANYMTAPKDGAKKRYTPEPRGPTSDIDFGANNNAKDGDAALICRGGAGQCTAVSLKEMSRIPCKERAATLSRVSLPTQKPNGVLMARDDPALLAKLIEELKTMYDVQVEALRDVAPWVTSTLERAVPRNGTIIGCFPVCISSPRALHDSLPFSVSTVFMTQIRNTAQAGGLLRPVTDDTERHELAQRLLPRAGGLRILTGPDNVHPHVDRHDAYQTSELVDGERVSQHVYATYHGSASVIPEALAPDSGCTIQLAGVGNGNSHRVGVRDLEACNKLGPIVVTAAPFGGVQTFNAHLTPHASTEVQWREGSSDTDSERQGHAHRWKAAHPTAPQKVNSLVVAPEARFFFNGRNTQGNLDAYQALHGVAPEGDLVMLATTVNMRALRLYGVLPMEGRELTLCARPGFLGVAWQYCQLTRPVNRAPPEAASTPPQATELSEATRQCITNLRRLLRPPPRAKQGTAPKLVHKLQYCSLHALRVGDSVEIRWRSAWRRSRVTRVHATETPLPAHFGDYAKDLVGGYMYTYDLEHYEPHACRKEGASSCEVRLADHACRNIICFDARRSRRKASITRQELQSPPTPDDVGRRLQVFWPKDEHGMGAWHDGKLVEVVPTCDGSDSDADSDDDDGPYRVCYDDGDELMERLGTRLPYRWLSEPCPVVAHQRDGQPQRELLGTQPPYHLLLDPCRSPGSPPEVELLRTQGYAVLPHAIFKPDCKRVVEHLRHASWEPKGLPWYEGEDTICQHDPRRQQTSAAKAKWIHELTGLLTDCLDEADLIECAAGTKAVVHVHGLKSRGIDGYDTEASPEVQQDGDQSPHTDEYRDRYDEWVRTHPHPSDAPMSVMLAVMPGTRLRIFANDKWHILNLMVGDVVVFRGDILHNGLGYPREHLRIHAYLYPPGYDHPSEVHFERASPTAPGAL